jgi:hypothetical protein
MGGKARKRVSHLFDTGRDTGKAVTPVERLTAEVDALRGELRRRTYVDHATGLLAGRLGCSLGEAFEHLTRMALDTQTTVTEAAAVLVTPEGMDGLPDPALPAGGPAPDRIERERWEATLLLQRAILPTPLQRFRLGRYEVSARYRPAEPGTRAGGDWYDARLGPDGSAVVAIGDVAGHGLAAAAGMTRIGNALRGLSATGYPANTLLSWLNQLICSDESPERVASAALLILAQDRPALHWAQAGHPPPVLVTSDTARLLARPAGLLLGTVPTAQYDLASEELTAGDILFLYTDGLIERRDRDIDDGLTALLTAAGHCAGQTADQAITTLLHHLDPPATEDDISLLAIHVRGGMGGA